MRYPAVLLGVLAVLAFGSVRADETGEPARISTNEALPAVMVVEEEEPPCPTAEELAEPIPLEPDCLLALAGDEEETPHVWTNEDLEALFGAPEPEEETGPTYEQLLADRQFLEEFLGRRYGRLADDADREVRREEAKRPVVVPVERVYVYPNPRARVPYPQPPRVQPRPRPHPKPKPPPRPTPKPDPPGYGPPDPNSGYGPPDPQHAYNPPAPKPQSSEPSRHR